MAYIRIVIPLIVMLAGISPDPAFAYDRATHEGITQAVVRGYEKLRGDTFNVSEEASIISGSSAEDDDWRFLNHFYDPISYRGLTVLGIPLGAPSESWAFDTRGQASWKCVAYLPCSHDIEYNDKLFSSPTDYSWDRAIYEYVYGDKERGLESLGHTLHLLEDATVPAHVRNDQHGHIGSIGDADPYETFTSQFTSANINTPDDTANVPAYSSLSSFLDHVARFTNTHFVSKDTVLTYYTAPDIKNLSVQDGFAYDSQTGSKVVQVDRRKVQGGKDVEKYILDGPKHLVVSDNWNILSKTAILNGIGVVDLFFKEVEQEKKTGAIKAKNFSAAELNAKELAKDGFKYVKALYGSSLEQSDVEELLNDNAGQAGAAALAVADVSAPPQNIEPAKPSTPAVNPPVPPQPPAAPEVLGESVSIPEVPTAPEQPQQSAAPSADELQTSTQTSPSNTAGGISGGSPTQVPDVAAESATSTETVVDTTPPDTPTIAIDECAASFAGDCTVATTTVTISWSAASGASYYEVLKDSVTLSTTTAMSATSSITAGATTAFAVVAHKSNGTAATSTEKTASVVTQPLLLHEIAWAGTNASSDDEWIELRNVTSSAIDLSHFVITNSDGSRAIALSGTMVPVGAQAGSGFLVVERSAGAVSGVPNVLTSDFTQLSDAGEQLLLQWGNGTATSTVDMTPDIATCGGWCAGASAGSTGYSVQSGTSTARLTMERKSVSSDGSLAASWQTTDAYSFYGTDRDSSSIYGTPGVANSNGHPTAGWYCNPDTTSITSGAHYTPPSTSCTYLMRAISTAGKRYGALYRGDMGSSTLLSADFYGPAYMMANEPSGISDPQDGEDYFIAIYETRIGPNFDPPFDDQSKFDTYFKTGSGAPPHSNYFVIPWTYGP